MSSSTLTKKSSGRQKASQILLFAKFAPLFTAAYFGVSIKNHVFRNPVCKLNVGHDYING